MRKTPVILLAGGLLCAYFYGAYSLGKNSQGVVLAQKTQYQKEVTQNSSETPVPTAIPTETPTETPIPTEVPTTVPTKTQEIIKPTPTLVPIPTETPVPTPTPEVTAPADLEPLFDQFASAYSVDKNKLKKIADCESHFNNAVWAEPYAGMYQFTDFTWTKYRNQMGASSDINLRFGARESIETAAYVLSVGDEHIWPACSLGL